MLRGLSGESVRLSVVLAPSRPQSRGCESRGDVTRTHARRATRNRLGLSLVIVEVSAREHFCRTLENVPECAIWLAAHGLDEVILVRAQRRCAALERCPALFRQLHQSNPPVMRVVSSHDEPLLDELVRDGVCRLRADERAARQTRVRQGKTLAEHLDHNELRQRDALRESDVLREARERAGEPIGAVAKAGNRRFPARISSDVIHNETLSPVARADESDAPSHLTELDPFVMINVMGDTGVDAEMRPPGVVTGLYWAVRESFVGYVAGSPDGQVFGDGGVETDGEGTFRFPLASETHAKGRLHLRFEGIVRFIAHGGMLDVMLGSPEITLGDEVGSLVVTHGSSELRILDVTPAEPVELEGGWRVFPPLMTTLTAAGSSLFGDVYEAGEPFAPIQIALPARSAAS